MSFVCQAGWLWGTAPMVRMDPNGGDECRSSNLQSLAMELTKGVASPQSPTELMCALLRRLLVACLSSSCGRRSRFFVEKTL